MPKPTGASDYTLCRARTIFALFRACSGDIYPHLESQKIDHFILNLVLYFSVIFSREFFEKVLR